MWDRSECWSLCLAMCCAFSMRTARRSASVCPMRSVALCSWMQHSTRSVRQRHSHSRRNAQTERRFTRLIPSLAHSCSLSLFLCCFVMVSRCAGPNPVPSAAARTPPRYWTFKVSNQSGYFLLDRDGMVFDSYTLGKLLGYDIRDTSPPGAILNIAPYEQRRMEQQQQQQAQQPQPQAPQATTTHQPKSTLASKSVTPGKQASRKDRK